MLALIFLGILALLIFAFRQEKHMATINEIATQISTAVTGLTSDIATLKQAVTDIQNSDATTIDQLKAEVADLQGKVPSDDQLAALQNAADALSALDAQQ